MTRRILALALLALLAAPARAAAQFTIPNNDASGIASNPQSIWMQADIDALAAGINGQGVVYGAAVTAQGTPDMTVAVSAGKVVIGHAALSVSSGNVTIPAAHATLPRVDLVTVNSSGAKVETQGTAAANPAAPAIPATSVLLAMVYIPAADTTISAGQIVDKRVLVTLGESHIELSVLDYGAVCDGSTDDTTALQAAFTAAAALTNAAADVYLPPTTCNFSDTLTIGTAGGAYSHINLIGQSEDSSQLKYTGSTDGRPAIMANHIAYFHWRGFALTRSGARGSSIGLLVGATSGSGTQALAGTFEHITFDGFFANAVIGGVGISVADGSELYWLKNKFQNADVCWTDRGFNSLNFVLEQNDFSTCGTGIDLGHYAASDRVIVRGGAYASNDCDFSSTSSFSSTYIEGVRSEGAGKVMCGNNWQSVTVKSSVFNGPSADADDVLVDVTTIGAMVFDTVEVNGMIKVAVPLTFGTSLTIVNSQVKTGTNSMPFLYGSDQNASGGRLFFKNNVQYSTLVPFADLEAQTLMDSRQAGHVNVVFISPIIDQTASIADAAPIGADLLRTRSLAYGSSVAGKNLRDQITFATSATAAFLFTRTVSVTTVSESPTISFSSGAISAKDIGKKIVIPDVACFSAAQFTGAVVSITDATHAVVAGAQDACGAARITSAATKNATVGEDEPDANYFLTLGCDADERFHWSSKATTGFTLTSSNASSTATCDIIVVR